MPSERMNIGTGRKVMAYTEAEAYNLGARMLARSEGAIGLFALGIMIGMKVADPTFKKSPHSTSVSNDSAYASTAMAMATIEEDMTRLKEITIEEEQKKGADWLAKKISLIERMLQDGKEMNESIDEHLNKLAEKELEKELKNITKKETTND